MRYVASWKKTNVHGSFRELEDIALNPLTLGVHTNEHYNRDSFPLSRLILIMSKTGYGDILYYKAGPF